MLFGTGRDGPVPVAAVPAWPGVATPGAIGQPGDAPPDPPGVQLRRWAGLLALAGLILPGPAPAGVDGSRAEAQHTAPRSGAAAPPPAVTESPLPLGDPWEAAVVEPRLEAPAVAAPWEAAAVEPDGTPLPAAPADAGPALSAPPFPAPVQAAPRVQAAAPVPAGGQDEEPRRRAPGTARSSGLVPPEREYLRKPLVRYAQENGLPADLVMALAWKESSWRARAVSEAGAVGVMQLMPGTVAFTSRDLLGLKYDLDPRDAVANVRMGTRFLRHLVDRSGGHYRQALIAYYQGITSLRARGPYGESERYADAVLALRSRFRRP